MNLCEGTAERGCRTCSWGSWYIKILATYDQLLNMLNLSRFSVFSHSLISLTYFCLGLEKPTFDNRCKVFELDPCDGYGRVCLVYKESKTGNSPTPNKATWKSQLPPLYYMEIHFVSHDCKRPNSPLEFLFVSGIGNFELIWIDDFVHYIKPVILPKCIHVIVLIWKYWLIYSK